MELDAVFVLSTMSSHRNARLVGWLEYNGGFNRLGYLLPSGLQCITN